MTVHVIGTICVDTSLTVPRFPEPGETLANRVGLGGKGLNQSAGVERIPADDRGLALRLHAVPQPSDTSTVLVRPDSENLIVSATACARAFGARGRRRRGGWRRLDAGQPDGAADEADPVGA